jgi:putative FmdB family regulatory protein
MPLYEYYCRTCSAKFELLRPMSDAATPATCPAGHPGGMRTLSVFATVAKGADGVYEPAESGAGCACGGGGCGCGH